MDLNLPNKLTLLRVFLIPVFIYFYLASPFPEPFSVYAALAVFLAAAATDALDGYIARKYNLTTNFGKLMDPLADKLLVVSAMIAMVQTELFPSWAAIVIVAREFLITGFRTVAAERGIIIAASFTAKIKTASQIVMTAVLLLNISEILNCVFIWIAVILTVVSAVEYIVKNKSVIYDKP